MAESKYTAPNDFRAFCEMLGETETSMAHHGVKGQKWGVRKYQNTDGSLTAAGRKHYGYGPGRKSNHGDAGEVNDIQDESDRKIAQITKNYEFNKEYTLRDPIVKQAISVAKAWDAERSNEIYLNEEENRKSDLKRMVGKGATIGAGIGTGVAAGVGATAIADRINKSKIVQDPSIAVSYITRMGEKILKENTITEKILKENTLTENMLKENRLKEIVNGASKEYEQILRENSRKNNLTQPTELEPYAPKYNVGVIGAASIASGAAVGAGVGGLIHGVRAVRAKRANEMLSRTINDISMNQNIDKKTGLKLKNAISSPDVDMAKVNPGFNNWSDGTKSNCLICTATYALRRKGFDVTANGANDGYDTTAILQAFPKATMRRVHLPNTNKNNELSSVLNIPEGGYGNMSVTWKAGGGHSMVVSVEGGRVVVRDTQSNKVYRGSAVNKILSQTTGEARVIRLDNADPDIAQMKKMGMINPLGQSFKINSKVITQSMAGAAKQGGKHGDTGMVSDALIKAAVTYGAGKLVPMAADAGQKIAGRIKERYEQRKSTKAKT